MHPHEQRVVDEHDELQTKCEKLGAFFDTELFRSLPNGDQELLAEQAVAMGSYLHILDRRIERFNPSAHKEPNK